MNYTFHPEAEAEFLEAIAYYEERQPGLGHDLAVEVYSAIKIVLESPKVWPLLVGDMRRCQTHRFPYGIVYSEELEGIYILAVMHLHRDPDYWVKRVPRNQS